MHVEEMKERGRTEGEELHETSITRAAPPGITRSDNLYMFNRYRKQESNEDKRLENEDNKRWPKEDHMRDSFQMHRELKILIKPLRYRKNMRFVQSSILYSLGETATFAASKYIPIP